MKKEFQDLFNALNHLCETNEAFYYSEQDYLDRYVIRSYSYRLASYTDFQAPYAKASRGTAFIYDKKTKEWNLFCRAMDKFWNLGEGIPKDEFIKDNNIQAVYEKVDGSLIMFGIVNDTIVIKSKTSINSDHAKLAQKLLNENKDLQNYIREKVKENKTVICELVSPEYRIVLGYEKDELIYLCDVDNETGKQTVDLQTYRGIRNAYTYDYSWEELQNIQENSQDNIEGFIVYTDKGIVKAKTAKYINLHHTKDSVNNLKNLVALILDDDIDDLLGLLEDDKKLKDYVIDTQNKVTHKFNHLVQEYINLRGLYFNKFQENRKEFALKHSKEPLFSAVMKSLNTSFKDVNETAVKQVKEYVKRQCKTETSTKKWLENL